MTDRDWVQLSSTDEGLEIRFGCDRRSGTRVLVPAAQWIPAWEAHELASEIAAATPFPSLRGPEIEPFHLATAEAITALQQLYMLIASALPDEMVLQNAAVLRSPDLLALSTSLAMALARPKLRTYLPHDLHPAQQFAHPLDALTIVRGWVRPTIADLAILIPDYLGAERALPVFQVEPDAVMVATFASWAARIERTLTRAITLGAKVIRPLDAASLLAALEGEFGQHLLIVAHLEGTHLHVDSNDAASNRATVDLRLLADELADAVAAGWRSPLLSVDLSYCHSAEFVRSFVISGVPCIASRTTTLHFDAITRTMERALTAGYYDGATTPTHVWVRAALDLEGDDDGNIQR